MSNMRYIKAQNIFLIIPTFEALKHCPRYRLDIEAFELLCMQHLSNMRFPQTGEI